MKHPVFTRHHMLRLHQLPMAKCFPLPPSQSPHINNILPLALGAIRLCLRHSLRDLRVIARCPSQQTCGVPYSPNSAFPASPPTCTTARPHAPIILPLAPPLVLQHSEILRLLCKLNGTHSSFAMVFAIIPSFLCHRLITFSAHSRDIFTSFGVQPRRLLHLIEIRRDALLSPLFASVVFLRSVQRVALCSLDGVCGCNRW